MVHSEDDIPTGEFEIDEDGVLRRPRKLNVNDLIDIKAVIREIDESNSLRLIKSEFFQPASDVVVTTIESGIGIAVPDNVLSFYQVISDGLEFEWNYKESDGTEQAGGGFHLYNFGRVFGTWVDEIWGVVPDGASETEHDFSWELRPVEAPHKGGSHYTVLHVPDFAPGYGLYYHDPNHSSYRLDLDFASYFDCLLETRGFYGWQFLVSDVDFDQNPVAKQRARAFHEVMPRLFPDTDFSRYRTAE